jgi:hypothetical protein
MSAVGFESRTPVFERAKTVHALDRAATVIGQYLIIKLKYYVCWILDLHIGEYEVFYLQE